MPQRSSSPDMREKTLKFVVTFHTTADAIAMERCCLERGIPGRIIPLPTVISADCGMCWAAPPEAEEAIENGLKQSGLRCAGTYLLLL